MPDCLYLIQLTPLVFHLLFVTTSWHYEPPHFSPICNVIFFFFFRATPVAHGISQARGRIWAIAAGLHHSHSNAGSLTHWARPGIEPVSSWLLVRFILLSHYGNSRNVVLLAQYNHSSTLLSSPNYFSSLCKWSPEISSCISLGNVFKAESADTMDKMFSVT